MEVNITKETLNVNKVVCEKKEIINIQGDMIVPDSKPDILNTLIHMEMYAYTKKKWLTVN